MMRAVLMVCAAFFWFGLCVLGVAKAGSERWRAVDGVARIVEMRGDFAQLTDNAQWQVEGDSATTPDETFGMVLTAIGPRQLALQGVKVLPGEVEVSCRVRLSTSREHPNVSFTLSVGQQSADDRGLWLTLSATSGSDAVGIGFGDRAAQLFPPPGRGERLDWMPTLVNSLTYSLRAFSGISDSWPLDFRAGVEKDMASLPQVADKWISVCYEVRGERLRLWVDDRLVADRGGFRAQAGTMRLTLSPGCQLAHLRVTAPADVPLPFEPLAIDDYCNSSAILGQGKDAVGLSAGSLPGGGDLVSVAGIPFRFADRATNGGRDNVDLRRSLFRHRNWYGGYVAAGTAWEGALTRDPARIQLRVPNGRYEAVWVVAAADGEPSSIPLFSAMFYRPGAGFPKSFSTEVPLFSSKHGATKALPVTFSDGRKANLWLVRLPLDPGALSSFSDMPFLEMELTKQVQQMRSYPDPFYYSSHQAGLPSGVHIYAITLELPAIEVTLEPTRFGHVFTSPDRPGYAVRIYNRAEEPKTVNVALDARSYDGTEVSHLEKRRTISPGGSSLARFELDPQRYGWHQVTARVGYDGKEWTERRSFVYPAPDERAREWTRDGPLFGFWGYQGGHYMPVGRHESELMYQAGARAGRGGGINRRLKMRQQASAWVVGLQPWAMQEEYSEEDYDNYGESIVKAYREYDSLPEYDRPDHAFFFPEPHITSQIPREYFGLPPYQLTTEEKNRARGFIRTAKAAAEPLRREMPDLKIYVPWGNVLFMPWMLREGYPKELFDGIGLDLPSFERLPERQIGTSSTHNLWILKQELERAGCPNKELVFCEGNFIPTEPGACTLQEQQDYFIRWYLICMAYGVQKFYSGIFGFDCGDYYGAEHYGGCGSFGRIPYNNPKPLYGAYATMTALLEHAQFETWLPTGSLSTYCLRFNRSAGRGPVYALWTLRGKRSATLSVPEEARVVLTDIQGNGRTLQNEGGKVTLEVSTSPAWLTGAEEVGEIILGPPDNSDATPGAHGLMLDNFSKGKWRYDAGRDENYENNHWETLRVPAPMLVTYKQSPERGRVLQVELPDPEKDPRLMPLYGRLVPDKPIPIPGKASALGIWVKGNSSWGRIIYKLRDAKGELWTSIGSKDEWNCDDVHSWSFFNFDGWRYLRFPLPSHAPYDSFRELETTWWKSEGGDAVVDLPLSLEEMIVEMRTHVLYVNSPVQVAKPNLVQLSDLVAEYAKNEDKGEAVVALSAVRVLDPARDVRLDDGGN